MANKLRVGIVGAGNIAAQGMPNAICRGAEAHAEGAV